MGGLAAGVGRTAFGGLVDSVLEVKDSVIARQEAPPELIEAPTPDDRWWTPEHGWPKEVADFPAELTPPGYKVQKWQPPPDLVPTKREAPHLFDGKLFPQAARPVIGELRLEVLQCLDLPRLMVGIADPYVVVVCEGFAARVRTVRNDRSPCWGAEAPRAFRMSITCPYSTIGIAVNDEDEGPLNADDPLGRAVLDLSQLHGRTSYDAWYDLQYGDTKRATGSRGRLRLRFSVVWRAERLRLLAYTELPPPTFAVSFNTRKFLTSSSFAVQGKHKNPAKFDSAVMTAQIKDIQRALRTIRRTVLNVLFWKVPGVSIAVFIMYQLFVSYPTEFIAMVPAMCLLGMVRTYLALPAPHPLDAKLTVSQMAAILATGYHPAGIAYDGSNLPAAAEKRAVAAEEEDDEEEDEDEHEDEHEDGSHDHDEIDSKLVSSAPGAPPDLSTASEAVDGGGKESASGKDGGAGGGDKAAADNKTKAEQKKSFRQKLASGVGNKMSVLNPLAAVDTVFNLIKPPSLQEEYDQMYWEIEQEIYSQLPDEDPYTINPITKFFGPVQKFLYMLLIYMRAIQRTLTWEDRILSFLLCIALTITCVVTFFAGELLMLIPWGVVFEWTFRLLGVAAFGPHMYWVGIQYRIEVKAYREEVRLFDHGTRAQRKAIVDKYRKLITAEISERFAQETGDMPSEADELKALVASTEAVPTKKKVHHMMVRARPNAAQLRFRIMPDRQKTKAIPLFPSEDRPALRDAEPLRAPVPEIVVVASRREKAAKPPDTLPATPPLPSPPPNRNHASGPVPPPGADSDVDKPTLDDAARAAVSA